MPEFCLRRLFYCLFKGNTKSSLCTELVTKDWPQGAPLTPDIFLFIHFGACG